MWPESKIIKTKQKTHKKNRKHSKKTNETDGEKCRFGIATPINAQLFALPRPLPPLGACPATLAPFHAYQNGNNKRQQKNNNNKH